MKETKTINVGGYSFTIDVDASDNLQIYIDKLKQHFTKEEQEEILIDIEQRIADLFTERLQVEHREVIDTSDVNYAISVLGEPNNFDEEQHDNNDDDNKNNETTRENRVKNRKLYRSPSDAIIGGVCGGLASYFNIDVVWVRLITVLCVFSAPFFSKWGLGVLSGLQACIVPLYVILWIIVPKATTKAQLLQMQGKETTIDNIKNVNDTEIVHQNRGCLYNGISILGKICLVGLCVCIGGGLLIALVCGFAIAVAAPFAIVEAGQQFDIPTNVIMIGVGSLIVLVLTVLTALIGVCVHLYRSRQNKTTSPIFWWTLLALFLLSLGGSIYSTVNGFSKFMESEVKEHIFWSDIDNTPHATRTEMVEPFTTLCVSQAINVIYQIGDEYKVELDAPEKIINLVQVTSVGGQLKINFSNSGKSFVRGSVKAIVTAPTLDGLNVSSGAKFYAMQLVADNQLRINASSSGDIEISNLKTEICYVNASSGADVELAGETNHLYANLSSGADLDATALHTRIADVNASSGADAEVFVSDTISTQASSGADIEYSGTPVVAKRNASSGGHIKIKD